MVSKYTLYINNIQNDIERYINLAEINLQMVTPSARVIKQELRKYLDYFKNCNTEVRIQLFSNDGTILYLIFDFAEQDIYLKCIYRDKFIFYSLKSQKDISRADTDISDDYESISKRVPGIYQGMQMALIMNYNKIIKFINECWTEVIEADNFMTKVQTNIINKQNELNSTENTEDLSENKAD